MQGDACERDAAALTFTGRLVLLPANHWMFPEEPALARCLTHGADGVAVRRWPMANFCLGFAVVGNVSIPPASSIFTAYHV